MRLRECREKANLSQKYVALSLGVAAPSVSNWESGKTKPSRENTVRMADLYGVSVDYLIGRTDDPTPAANQHTQTQESESGVPQTTEAKILAAGIDRMPAKDRERALNLVRVAFYQYEEYFSKGDDADEA